MIVDISQYQGNINWTEARKHIELAIFRASIGANIDTKYNNNAEKCQIPFGVYHYLKAGTVSEARIEAQFFYYQATAAAEQPLFFCVDIEHKTQTEKNVKEITTAFATKMRELTTKKIGIYIGQSLYPYAAIDLYDFVWIPRYGKNTGEADPNYRPKYPCVLWQYTDKGKCSGINTNVDLNLLNGDKPLSWFTEGYGGNKVMAEKFSNTHFVEFLKKFVGQPYFYGTCVYACTNSLLNSKSKQYPKHYTEDRMSKYKQAISEHKICADCVGLGKGYAWTNGGENVIESIGLATPLFKNVYGSNGMPDQSANGMFEYAKRKGLAWGTIDTMPDIPGLAVRYDGHVGYYIGNGEVVEERGFAYGCVKTKLKDRKWLHWYEFPCIVYNNSTNTGDVTITVKLGDRLLKKGSKGTDVKELQQLLNEYFETGLEVDGDYGAKTVAAVKKMQSKCGVNADGEYGSKTHAAFMSYIADKTPDPTVEPTPTGVQYQTNGQAYVRTGDSTAYSIITSLPKNTLVQTIEDKNKQPIVSAAGWYAIQCQNQIGWISEKMIIKG